jgi:hypothetical protein
VLLLLRDAPHGTNAVHGILGDRNVFASRADAWSHLQSRPRFARFHPEALEAYARGKARGQRPQRPHRLCTHAPIADGFVYSTTAEGSVELACRPSFEAHLYRGVPNFWPLLPKVTVPTLFLVSAQPMRQALFHSAYRHFEKAAARMPHARVAPVGGTHFYAMEEPDALAQVALAELRAVAS